MREIEAVLFDFDGTVVDTVEQSTQAFESTFDSFGLPQKSRSEIKATYGLTLARCYEILVPGFPNIEELCTNHNKFQAEHPELVSSYPNMEETLSYFKELGLKIGVVTSRGRGSCLGLLESTGLLKYMDTVVTRNDCTLQKPNPEPVQMALNNLNIPFHNAVMVGDSGMDILAGKAAGTITVGVAYGSQGKEIARSYPDYVIDGISNIVPVLHAEMRIQSGSMFE
jgi:pyrophosphatase PpaX